MAIWPFRKSAATAARQSMESRCSFCARPQSVVGPMVEGPNAAFICVDCVRLAAHTADANAGRSLPPDSDPIAWRSAHMNVVCYARVHEDDSGIWTAEASSPSGLKSQGPTAKKAVHRLQAMLLELAAKALLDENDAGPHFTNHADA